MAERHRLLANLNLFGLDHLDPVLLAALADERPLLLIGPHGTAKSELLNRAARALGLEHRHYNASLISFDDLLGYPVPDLESGSIRFLRTPASLWEAESVFIDELSRCRPETANKLFSVIHERRVQGLEIPRLRYRWAAMNPPPSEEQEEAADAGTAVLYTGARPLDPALADRFPWVVELPSIDRLPLRARRRLIARGSAPPRRTGRIRRLLEAAQRRLARCPREARAWCAAWAEGLVAPLAEAGLPISGRRAVMLAASAASVEAAAAALESPLSLEEAAWVALRHGLPHPAEGRRLDEAVLSGVHRHACRTAGQPPGSPWHAILSESDPVRRIARAVAAPASVVDRADLSELLTDALATLPLPERWALSLLLTRTLGATDRLTAPALELLTEPVAQVMAFAAGGTQHVSVPRDRAGDW
ncbi:MAG: hypothetical protein D6739_04810, partial [Nitrospirae bacterium]